MPPPKPPKPKIAIALEPGEYIVSIGQRWRRAWRHTGNGVFEGHGKKIRRIAIIDGIHELQASGERADEKWDNCPKCGSSQFKIDREGRFVSPLVHDCDTVEIISHCFGCGHEVIRVEG